MIEKNGGPAFPLVIEEEGCITQFHKGMTLRDYFAGQALVGIIAHPTNRDSQNGAIFAQAAYRMADAMLEARK